MDERACWIKMAEEIGFVGEVAEMEDFQLQFKITVFVQDRTDMGVMGTNGCHRYKKCIMVGENWLETNDMSYQQNVEELQKEVSEQLKVPEGSILYQPVTVNIHYPRSNTCNQDVLVTAGNTILEGHSTRSS